MVNSLHRVVLHRAVIVRAGRCRRWRGLLLRRRWRSAMPRVRVLRERGARQNHKRGGGQGGAEHSGFLDLCALHVATLPPNS